MLFVGKLKIMYNFALHFLGKMGSMLWIKNVELKLKKAWTYI